MIEDYVEATKGPNGEPGVVIVHVEACDHLHRMLNKIRDLGGSPSVALNPHSPAEMIKNVICDVDHVLVMTVNPGFGGQAYISTMLDKIRTIRGYIVEGGYELKALHPQQVRKVRIRDRNSNWSRVPQPRKRRW